MVQTDTVAVSHFVFPFSIHYIYMIVGAKVEDLPDGSLVQYSDMIVQSCELPIRC